MMSHLDRWQPTIADDRNVADVVRREIARHFWAWYRLNENMELLRILFWTKRVRDIKWLFVRLFGEPV